MSDSSSWRSPRRSRGGISVSYLLDLRRLVGSRPLLAVGADVLVIQSRSLLLQRRIDDGLWSIPGGGLELGESLEGAARRELWEETGLQASELRLLTVCSGPEYFHRYPNGDEIYNVTAMFLAVSVTGELRPDPNEG